MNDYRTYLENNSEKGYQLGWVCPKCGSVFGPNEGECRYCNAKQYMTITCMY